MPPSRKTTQAVDEMLERARRREEEELLRAKLQTDELLQKYGGQLLLRAVASSLIDIGDASSGPVVGRVIRELAEVEW